jgi:hypothetical protein
MTIGLNNLCTPALLYLAISALALVVMGFQNMGSESVYCLGSYTCDVSSTTLIFIIKIVYIIFWTWLLNIVCKSGFTGFAWFLVLFPFIILFILISSIFLIEFDNPFKVNQVSALGDINIPFFSSFYNWIMY